MGWHASGVNQVNSMHEIYRAEGNALPPGMAEAASLFSTPADALYLDTAAQGPRLHAVLTAGHAALEAGTQPWRLSFEAWEARIQALRTLTADTLFEGDGDGVAMVPSVAQAMATAARNLPLQAGDAVLVLDAQFPSNLLAWQQRCDETSARIVAVSRQAGEQWTAAVLAALQSTPRVRVVSLPQAHWHDGALLDFDRIAPAVRAAGAALVLDLSQSLGVLPLELQRWQPDFVAAVGHKWLLGPTGLAWLWAGPRWRSEGVPIEQHWQARDAGDAWAFPSAAAPPYRAGARRFDAGGVTDLSRLAMSSAAMRQVQAWGVEAIRQRLGQLTCALDEALDAHGLSAWKTPGHAPHLTALRAPDPTLLDVAWAALQRESIICTRRAGLLRVAPHLHASEHDMQRVAQVVAAAVCA